MRPVFDYGFGKHFWIISASDRLGFLKVSNTTPILRCDTAILRYEMDYYHAIPYDSFLAVSARIHQENSPIN